jgi:hypothetical protein
LIAWQPLLQPGEYNQPEDEYNQPEVYNHYNHPAQHTPGVSYHASPSAIEQSQQNICIVQQPLDSTPMTYVPSCPHDHLAPSLIVCLFCFWPTAIAALICAFRVNDRYDVGDYNGARRASRLALLFVKISFGIGVSLFILFIISYIIVFLCITQIHV